MEALQEGGNTDISELETLSPPPTHLLLNGAEEFVPEEETPRSNTPAISDCSVEPNSVQSPPPSSRTTPTPSNGSAVRQELPSTLEFPSIPSLPPSSATPVTPLNRSAALLEPHGTFEPSLLRNLPSSSAAVSAPSNRIAPPEEPQRTFRLSIGRSLPSIGTRSTWPNPEESIGPICNLLEKQNFKCWEAKGPALEFNDELRPELLARINSKPEDVWGKSKPSFLLIRIFMVGNSEANAKPFLIVSGKKEPRQRAAKLIRESKILEKFRDRGGLKLIELRKPPVRLLSGDRQTLGWEMMSVVKELVYHDPSLEVKENFGVQIYVQCRNISGSLYWNKATVGCILRHEGKYLAWTAAHVFLDIPESTKSDSNSEDESDIDFKFEDDDILLDFNEDPPESAPKDSGASQTFLERPLDTSNFASTSEMLIGSQNQPPKLEDFGSLFASSIIHDETGLDWALIEISEPKFTTTTALTIINGVNPLVEVHHKPIQTEVFAATGSSGVLKGQLSPMPTYMALPPNSTFREVWSVRFDGPLAKGDCGSLVLDATGNIYGHVVAGELENGIAYIIPAVETLADMKSRLGDQLSFSRPQLENWQETFDALIAEEMNSAPAELTGDFGHQGRQYTDGMPSVMISEHGGDIGSLFSPRPRRDVTRTPLSKPTTGSGQRPEQQSDRGDELVETAGIGSWMHSMPSAAPQLRSRRVTIPRVPVTLPARYAPSRVRPRGTRKRHVKRLYSWDMRIHYPRNAANNDERRAAVFAQIDNREFDLLLVLASGSGIFAASYALFAPSMILPSLNFAYWPNSTSLDKNIQIRAVSLTGTVVGSLTSGFLSDKFGRRAVIRLGPLLLLIGAICCAEASAGFNNQTMAFLGWILFSQFLIGFGAGVEFTLSAVTAAEFAPAKARGRMMAAVILMQPFASLVVSALVLILLVTLGKQAGLRDDIDRNSAGIVVDKMWRYVVGLGAIPAIGALYIRFGMPESPRWILDVPEDENHAMQEIGHYGRSGSTLEMDDAGGHEFIHSRLEMSQIVIPLNSLPRQSTVSVPDSALVELNSEADISEIEAQEVGNDPNGDYEEERTQHYSISLSKLRDFFQVEGNWRPLLAVLLCSFFLNTAMSGLGGDNYRILPQVWSSTYAARNSSPLPAFSDGQFHSSGIGAEIYDVIFDMALHSIVIFSSAACFGGLILVKFVSFVSRRQLLAYGPLCLTGLFAGLFGAFRARSDSNIQVVKIVLYVLCYGIFSLGPNLMLFMIPTEIFPTRYRATAFALTFSFGKLGSIVGQTVTTYYSSGGKDWTVYFIVMVPLLFAAYVFAWVWLPEYGRKNGMALDSSSYTMTLEALADRNARPVRTLGLRSIFRGNGLFS